MKNLIATILIFFTGSIFAMSEHDVYVTDNDAGGKIYLFYYQCPIASLSESKVSMTVAESQRVFGCWISHDGKIYVVWFPEGISPVEAVYEPSIFTLEKLL